MKYRDFKKILIEHAHLSSKPSLAFFPQVMDNYEPMTKSKWRFFTVRFMTSILSMMLILTLLITGAILELTPTYSMSIDLNPGFEITLNRFDRVIGIKPIGDDALIISDKIKYWLKSPEVVIENIYDVSFDAGMISSENILLITMSKNDDASQVLLQKIIDKASSLSLITLMMSAEKIALESVFSFPEANQFFVKTSSGLYLFDSTFRVTSSSSQEGSYESFYDAIQSESFPIIGPNAYVALSEDDLKAIAKYHGITIGKLQLVITIFNLDNDFDSPLAFQILTKMSLNELYALYQENIE
jgi:hypothetical protein